MRSKAYWERRAVARQLAIEQGAVTTTKEILALYEQALKDIQNDASKLRSAMAARYGITYDSASTIISRAKKDENLKRALNLLVNAPNDQARKQIYDFINRDGLSPRAYAARDERLDALQSEIWLRMKELSAEESTLLNSHLNGVFSEAYWGRADDIAKGLNVGLSLSSLPTRAIQEAVSSKWQGATFSERIWKHTDVLASTAQNIITTSLISGEGIAKTSRKLSTAMGVAEHRATTLVRTETNHIMNEAHRQAMEDIGIQKYMYLATLDDRTCDICGPLDGEVFNLKDAKEGENYPSMHPRCRCDTCMADFDIKERIARDPQTGENYKIDGSVTYKEWSKGLTNQNNRDIIQEHKQNGITKITEKAIASMPKLIINGVENEVLRNKFQDLMREAMNVNSNQEVALILDRDGNFIRYVNGERSSVDLNRYLNQAGITVAHNHPGNNSTSITDIDLFIKTPNIKAIVTIPNTCSRIEYISKTDKFNGNEAIIELNRNIVKCHKIGNKEEAYKATAMTIKDLKKKGMIICEE